MLRPDENEFIYGKVIFEPNNDKTVWTATIKNYQANLSQLKVVFKAVADHITVGNVKQVSGETPNDSVVNPSDSYSGFPVLALITENEKAVDSKDNWVPGRMVFDPQQSDYTLQSETMNIKGRGHNSWGQPKSLII